MKGPYDDILLLPHHQSKRHPQMPRIDRAAQFAPFAALSGYETAIRETRRLSEMRTAQRNEGELIAEEDTLFSDTPL